MVNFEKTPSILSAMTFWRAIPLFFRHSFLAFLLFFQACAVDQPITITWGPQEWVSSTHMKTALHITIPDTFKFYGPAQATDTIKRPPELSWEGSENIAQVLPHWPAPELMVADGQKSHIYKDTVQVPVDIFVSSRGSAYLDLKIEGLVCQKMCYPFQKNLTLDLVPPPLDVMHWLNMLFFAFIGGLVLNVMPCVLPVLGLKLRGLTDQSPVGLLSVMTSAGILCGFWGLAAIIILFKVFFGHTIGWGVQLQSPLFSSLFAVMMIGAGYSLFGFFKLEPPQWIYGLMGKNRQSRGLQFFFSGLLAVLLATPCSAPFLGPAVGFALTGNAFEIFLFYTCIGLGFAFPYLLILILPVTKFLPKPGQWMLWVEKGMGVLFLLSAGWFIGWPFASFLSPEFHRIAIGLWALLCAIPLLGLLRLFDVSLLKGKILRIFAPLVAASVLVLLPFIPQEKAKMSMRDGAIMWMTYDPEVYAQKLQEGKMIYIDTTALGCALCMVNKNIYKDQELQKLLTQPDVVCMRADYSHADPKILHFMQRYGRAAIPFNLFISKHHSQGIVLSEILTGQELKEAIHFIREKKNRHESAKK